MKCFELVWFGFAIFKKSAHMLNTNSGIYAGKDVSYIKAAVKINSSIEKILKTW